jgi:dienelactone hydrolase
MNPNRFHRQAIEFARRGFATLVVMRRGYGDSGGAFAESSGPCTSPDYLRSARTSAEDLRAAVEAMNTRGDVTTEGMIAVGQSAGGLASVALGANPPAGLVAVINFAGGRGSPAPNQVCTEERLVETFGVFGKTSRLPELWVYTQNDQYFGPELAKKFHAAFTASGGVADFIAAPAFGTDGHNLFSSGVSTWTPMVDRFLRAHNLGLRTLLAEPALPDVKPPPQLAQRNLDQFTTYLKDGNHKAFAISPNGAFGWRSGQRSIADAKSSALETCAKYATNCAIYAVDDGLAAR